MAATITAPLGLALFSEDRPWAITREHLHGLIRSASQVDIEAAARQAGRVEGGGPLLKNYNGTGVINVRGALFPYRSIWTWLLGGTAVEDISAGLQAALDEPAVRSIVLAINSPGGQIDGINELANGIRAANEKKPVTAYVSGMGASAAYWLASAAGRIVSDETAHLGSIGVLATVFDDTAAMEKHGVKKYEIVSSQSPLKRTDPATTEGRAQLQQMVDGLAQVFIDKVAGFRGFTQAKIERDFGQGAVVAARAAVTVGMADTIGSLESLLGAEALDPAQTERQGIRIIGSVTAVSMAAGKVKQADQEAEDLTDEAGRDDDSDEDAEDEAGIDPPVEGATDVQLSEERQRIAAILNCEEARGRENLARTLALTTDHDLATAQAILRSAPEAAAPRTDALDARMSQIPNPNVGVPGEENTANSVAAEVQRILAYVPPERLRRSTRVQ
jgi:signal peptide peptidase SppA